MLFVQARSVIAQSYRGYGVLSAAVNTWTCNEAVQIVSAIIPYDRLVAYQSVRFRSSSGSVQAGRCQRSGQYGSL